MSDPQKSARIRPTYLVKEEKFILSKLISNSDQY